jgi:predicted NBD/HSP70 family sugar kinase
MHLLGMDIGGTKTSVCLADEHGAITRSMRFSSKIASQDEYFETLRRTSESVRHNLESQLKIWPQSVFQHPARWT